MDPCCPPGWGVLVAACTHGMGLGDPNPRWPRAIWARGVWPGVAAGCVGWRYGGAWLCAAPWPPFLPLPLLPPGLQLRARARGVKIVQQQPPAPARRGEGVCSSLHVPSTGTSQNSHGDRGAGALQPPQARSTGPAQLPAGPLGACSPRPPPALSSPPQPQGDGAVGAPQDPCFWGQLRSQRGATCSHDRGTRHRIALLAGARQLCPPFAPSSPSPIRSAHLHRGEEAAAGAGSSAGSPGAPRAPGAGGEDGALAAAARSPAPLPRAPPHHHAFFLLFLLLQVSHGEPS